MQKAYISITAEGFPVISLCAFSALIFALIGCWPMATLFLFLTWFSCHFFRDPERVIPSDGDIAVSPADGKVIRIEKRFEPFSGNERQCISIFMNVFSVHVNRSPVKSEILDIKYFPGNFMNAAYDKASLENERCAYLLREDGAKAEHTFTMVQISGLIARRIVCRVSGGDKLERGERFGMIRFGSRVDLYLPEDYVPAVNIGEQVFAGQTMLAVKSDAE